MTSDYGIRFVGVLATLFVSSFATAASAEERCGDASLIGSDAFNVGGTNVSVPLPGGPGPFVATGRNTHDGKGHLEGTIVVASSGATIPATYTNTSHVTPTAPAPTPRRSALVPPSISTSCSTMTCGRFG